MTDNVFAPYKINGLELSNRFVRSATWDGTADVAGYVTDTSLDYFKELGKGGIGLIVTGYAYVSAPEGQAARQQYAVYDDKFIPGLKKLAAAAHQDGTKIALQIVHAGIAYRFEEPAAMVFSEIPQLKKPQRTMADAEIEGVIDDFASAARRAREAGFDAVQLHGAHGYLLSQVLSPRFNFRTDRWGGSPENRRRFHLEILKRLRRAVGPDFPVLMKFGVKDSSPKGLNLAEGLAVAGEMERNGLDAIEVSLGCSPMTEIIRPARPGEQSPYLRDLASAVKKAVAIPVITVGGIRHPDDARDIVTSGDADLVAMCRPFIREPGLINRWRRENSVAACVSCNRCHHGIGSSAPKCLQVTPET